MAELSFYFYVFVLCILIGGCSPNVVNRDSQGRSIVCFGDSITAGYGAKPGEDYPSLLAQKVDRSVVNAGVTGQTTEEALKRLWQDVLAEDPYLVIVELGANDFLQRIPKAKTFTNLREIITEIQRSGAMVALATVKVGLLSDEYFSDYQQLARQKKVIFIPRIMAGIFTDPSLKSDGFHPNAKGYALIADKIYQAIKPFIGPRR